MLFFGSLTVLLVTIFIQTWMTYGKKQYLYNFIGV
jgi:hypothetical protein